jgi:hypothetical protein
MRTAFLFISLIILSGCSERKKSAADEAPREPAAFTPRTLMEDFGMFGMQLQFR